MHDEKSERSSDNLIKHPTTALSVERVDPSELDTVARVLAAAYTNIRYISGPCQRLPRGWLMRRCSSHSI